MCSYVKAAPIYISSHVKTPPSRAHMRGSESGRCFVLGHPVYTGVSNMWEISVDEDASPLSLKMM